jgi:hypothetical protein
MQSTNLRGAVWGASRWLGRLRSKSDLDWVIDQRDGLLRLIVIGLVASGLLAVLLVVFEH